MGGGGGHGSLCPFAMLVTVTSAARIWDWGREAMRGWFPLSSPLSTAASIHFSDGGGGGAKLENIFGALCAQSYNIKVCAKMKIVYVNMFSGIFI